MNPDDIIGLTVIMKTGAFLNVPVKRSIAEKVIADWSEGKYRDKSCQACKGKGTAFLANPGEAACDQPCPQCGGDGKDEYVIRSESPPGFIIRKWAFKPNHAVLMHTTEGQQTQGQGQQAFNPQRVPPNSSGPMRN